MSVSSLVKKSQQLISDNAPTLLTGIAVVGTVATGVLAARAGFKAGYMTGVGEATGGTPEKPSERRKLIAKTTWHLYLPSAISGVGTLTAVVAANKINANRLAGLAAAYTITDKAFSDYKDKVVETIGEKKEQTIHDSAVKDRVDASEGKSSLVIINGNDVLCYDVFSDRYFQGSMEGLKKAQNDTNYELNKSLYVNLSDFYRRVGLPSTKFSDEIGWNNDEQVELHYTTVMTPDGRPALGFTFHVEPVRGRYRDRNA